MLLVAQLLRDQPAGDEALDVARDAGRFSSTSDAVEALVDVSDAAKRAFVDCGDSPACNGWAQAAVYAKLAQGVVPRCTATQREQVRRQVLSYLEAVARTPAARTAPDPQEPPACR